MRFYKWKDKKEIVIISKSADLTFEKKDMEINWGNYKVSISTRS